MPLGNAPAAGKFTRVENILYRHATVKTIADSGVGDRKSARPFLERLRSALVGKSDIGAAIVALLPTRGPTHITGFIATRIVYAINGVLGSWTRADMGVERFKRFAPFLAHGNTASAIGVVAVIIRIVAAAFDMVPDGVFGRLTATMHEAMSRLSLRRQAAAMIGAVAAQVRAIHDYGVAAIAAAKPKALPLLLDMFGCWCWFENRQPSITFAGFVFEGRVTARGIMGLHHNLLRCGVMPWDVTASPGRSYSVLASPLYHVAEQMYTNPWPMEGRAVAELGVSIEAIIQQYAGR